jgi:hypothetical protein
MIKNKAILIDIVFCCLDNPNDLRNTLASANSVFHGEYNLRLICIDSSSNGEVKKVFERFSKVSESYYIWMEPSGIFNAMNLAISYARNDSYLWFLNPGDYVVDDFNLAQIMKDNLYVSRYDNEYYIFQAKPFGTERPWFPNTQDKLNVKNVLAGKFQISHQAFLISKKAALSLGCFEVKYSCCADLYMIVKAVENKRGCIIHEPLILFDQTGISYKRRIKVIWETLKISCSIDKFRSAKYFFIFVLRLFRYIRFKLKIILFPSKAARQLS